MLKNQFRILIVALILQIIFYFLLYIFSINSINGNPKDNWNGLALSFVLTFIAIPGFSIVLMSIYSVKESNFLHQIGIAIFNSMACIALLYTIFYKHNVSPSTKNIWYIKYAAFILFLSIVISFFAFAIKKIRAR